MTALQPRSTKIRKGSRTIAGRSIGILGLASGAAGDVLGETAPPHADHGSPASGARLRGRERPGNKIILLIETGSADVRDAAADCSPPSVTVAQPEAIDRLDVGKPPFAHLAAHPRRIMKVTFRHKQNPSIKNCSNCKTTRPAISSLTLDSSPPREIDTAIRRCIPELHLNTIVRVAA